MDASKIYEMFYGEEPKKYGVDEEGTIKYKSLDEICDKFPQNYADLLKLIVPIIINYLGVDSESAIIETLNSVEIIEVQQGEKNIEAVNKFFGSNPFIGDDSNGLVDEKALNNAVGMFCSEPILEEVQGKYQLNGERKAIIVRPLEYNYNNISTFIHEFLHAVKAQHDHFAILSDKNNIQYLVERNGLIHIQSSITTDEKGDIKTKKLREVNLGLEEGINDYDEENVMALFMSVLGNEVPENLRYIIDNVNMNSNGKTEIGSESSAMKSIIKHLMESDEMRQRIRNAQLLGEYKACQSFFNRTVNVKGINSWQVFNRCADIITDARYHIFEDIFNRNADAEERNEKMKKACNTAGVLLGLLKRETGKKKEEKEV